MTADAEALYAALDAIRDGRASTAAWRDVQRFVRTIERDEDRAQEALMRVHRAAARFEGRSVGEGVRWVRAIVVHRGVDVARRKMRDPLAHLVSARARDDEDAPPVVERVAAPTEGPDEARLQIVGERVLAVVADQSSSLQPSTRALAQVSAQAAWLRVVHQLSAEDLAACLPVSPPSSDALYKWVERGREAVLAAAAAMEPDDELGKETLEAIATLFATRRKDAGKPRLARRKKEKRP